MRNTSSAYKNLIYSDSREFALRVVITYLDGTTQTLTDKEDFMSLKISDACSDDSEFVLGAAVINEATITLNNRSGRFSGKDFFGAKINIRVGLMVNGAPEYLEMGDYLVDEPVSPGITIKLTAYDNMLYLDKAYVPTLTGATATLAQLVSDACTQCGVLLESSSFTRSTFVVNVPTEPCTCREVVSAAAALAGCFARINSAGKLRISWYDSAVTHQLTQLYSRNVCTDDVVITGITILRDGETIADSGADGYRLAIEDNILLPVSKAAEEAIWLSNRLVGLTFRPLTLTTLGDPSIEAGDKITATDEKGNTYNVLVTRVDFVMHGAQTIACKAASPAVNSTARLTRTAAAVIRARSYTDEAVQAERTAREIAIEELEGEVASASGLYETDVTQPDGSVIRNYHDKADLADSQVILRISTAGVTLSSDGGQHWTGVDYFGNAVLSNIYAIGINCDYLNTGTILAKKRDGTVVFSLNVETGALTLNLTEAGAVSQADLNANYYTKTQTNTQISTSVQVASDSLTSTIQAVDARVTEVSSNGLILSHTAVYTDSTSVTYAAKVYREGADATAAYQSWQFRWMKETESGRTLLGHGYSITINPQEYEFGGHLVLEFTTYENQNLAVRGGDLAVSQDDLQVRVSKGEAT